MGSWTSSPGLAPGRVWPRSPVGGIDPNKLITTVVAMPEQDQRRRQLGALSREQADKIIAMLPGLVSDVREPPLR